jgi:predicted transcriptional regulator/DNA-binding transcriptional ArsR family regulator
VSPSSSYGLNALKKLRIGELEKRILDVAGELEEFTLRELCEKLEQRGVVSKGSVKHAVSRLVEKGLLERVRKGVFRHAGDRFTKSAEDQFTTSTSDRFTTSIEDRFTKHYRSIHQIRKGSHADRFTKSTGDRFTKPTEDRFRISSGEFRDKSTSEQSAEATSKHEVVHTAETGSHKTPEFAPKYGDQETTPPATSTTTTMGAGVPAEGSKRPPAMSDHEIGQAYRGVAPSLAGTFGFLVHRVVLGFGFGVLPHAVLSVFSGGVCRDVRESGQLVCRDVVGGGRVVTFEFNVKSSGGLVFLEASESPLSVEEFLGFVDWYLLQVFRRLTGRDVSRSEFVVKAAPHINTDLPGVYLEGVKSITLQDYYDEVVRTYQKKIAGRDYTRVEVEAKSWVNNNLEDVVNGLVTYAKLPIIASKLEKISAKLEEIAEGGISGRAIAAAVKTDLANLIYAFYLKVADVLINQFAPAIAPEIGRAVKESIKETLREIEAVRREHGKLLAEFKKLSERVEKLTRENTELKRKLEEHELVQRQVKFDDLHEEIKQLLKKLEDAGLIRAKHERVEYGYTVWKAIHDYRGNVDFWLEEKLAEVIPETVTDYRLRRVVGVAIKAIVHYDNRYGDKPGVPYSLWLKKFEEYLKPLTLEQALQAVREHLLKRQEGTGDAKELEDLLRERLEKKK